MNAKKACCVWWGNGMRDISRLLRDGILILRMCNDLRANK